MKFINKYTKVILLAAVALTGFTSCEDEPDKYEVASGKPTVYYIRNLGSEIVGNLDTEETVYTNGQFVVEASPGSSLCLVGENLRSIYEMWVNDLQCVLNNSYITDNTMIVDLPSGIPSEVSDKIYLITQKRDTVTVDFHVVIPSPILNTVSNEYAKAGSTLTIVGRYFIDDPTIPIKVYFKDADGNNLEAEITSISEDYTTMTVVVPQGVSTGAITIENIYGEVTSTFDYMDDGSSKNSTILFDFDGGGIVMPVSGGKIGHGWHSVICQEDEWSISGAYMQLGNGSATMGDETWDDGTFSFEYWPGNWKDTEDYADEGSQRLIDIADFSSWEDMSLKFEICVPTSNPWSAAALQIIPASTEVVTNGAAGLTDIYGKTTGGCNNTYISGDVCPRALYRPWTTTGTFDTGDEWMTVTLPISSNFLYGYSGASATGTLSEESFSSLVMFLCGGGVSGTECTPIIKIDNIRVVKN